MRSGSGKIVSRPPGHGRLAQLVARFLHTEEVIGSSPVSPTNHYSQGMRILVAAAATVLALAACTTPTAEPSQPPTPSASPTAESTAPAGSIVLDPNKDYGDKYADGILPVGDGKFSLTGADVGTVYLCRDNFDYGRQTGPQTPGPWFVNDATEWDVNAKPAVAGSVTWDNELTITVADGIRSIITNDLPDHHTGEFPIAQDDPVREYDGNPNPISAQAIDLSLTQLPEYGAPQCIGGKVGVMLVWRHALQRLRRRGSRRRSVGSSRHVRRASSEQRRVPLPLAQPLHRRCERDRGHRVGSRRICDHGAARCGWQHSHDERSRRVPRNREHPRDRR